MQIDKPGGGMGATEHKHLKGLLWFFDVVPNQCTPNIHTIPESVDQGLSTGNTHVNVCDAQPHNPDFLQSGNVRIAGCASLTLTWVIPEL